MMEKDLPTTIWDSQELRLEPKQQVQNQYLNLNERLNMLMNFDRNKKET